VEILAGESNRFFQRIHKPAKLPDKCAIPEKYKVILKNNLCRVSVAPKFRRCTNLMELTLRSRLRRFSSPLNKFRDEQRPRTSSIAGQTLKFILENVRAAELPPSYPQPQPSSQAEAVSIMSSEWKIYRTRFLTRAKQLTTPMDFIDHLGRHHAGLAGDYLVETSDGVRRIAPREMFEDIYVELSPAGPQASSQSVQCNFTLNPQSISEPLRIIAS
jgi:hypothetical protein